MYSLQPGDLIEHKDRGLGVIQRPVSGGRNLVVVFEKDRMNAVVSRGDVVKINRNGQREELPSLPCTQPVYSDSVSLPKGDEGYYTALKVVEALRTGVSPGQAVELFTVGRKREMELVENDLNAAFNQGAARVFLGDYGSGKTHMLDCVEERALKQNFLVCRVTLDGVSVTPSYPRRVYRSLVKSIKYPDIPGSLGLYPLLKKASEKLGKEWKSKQGKRFHYYLTPCLNYFPVLEAMEDKVLLDKMMDWLEGHPTVSNVELDTELRACAKLKDQRIYALQDHRTLSHLFAYLLGGISCMAHDLGYSGLTILMDEAEFYSLLSSESRNFADLLFGYYSAAALGRDKVLFNVDEARRGGHAIHRKFPPIFAPSQFLYCVFAMTNDSSGICALQNILNSDAFSELTPLEVDDYKTLCKLVYELYCRAYPDFKTCGDKIYVPMGEILFKCISNGTIQSPRQALKFTVELFDYSRLCREHIREYMIEMRENAGL